MCVKICKNKFKFVKVIQEKLDFFYGGHGVELVWCVVQVVLASVADMQCGYSRELFLHHPRCRVGVMCGSGGTGECCRHAVRLFTRAVSAPPTV